MMFSTLVIDDEKPALDLICDYVEKTPFLSLKASFRDSFAALNHLHNTPVDLLLLDINMPSLSGLELISSLLKPPKVIFITAHPDFALQGFQLDALDFLVKPVRYPQFFKAASKMLKQTQYLPAIESTESKTLETLDAEDGYIFIKVDNRYQRVQLSEIQYIESCGDYVVYYLVNKKWISLQSMTQAIDSVSSRGFVRVHRSYIVNLRHVDRVYRDHLLIGELDISIGKSHQKNLVARLNQKN